MNPNDRAALVWDRMTQMYGQNWLTQFGDTPNDAWREAIATLNDAQIRNGLHQLGTSDEKFPPNLGQFVRACRTSPPAYHYPSKAIPDLRGQSTPESRARAHAAKCAIWQTLGMKIKIAEPEKTASDQERFNDELTRVLKLQKNAKPMTYSELAARR